jgi:hypothetical protein
VKYANHQDGGGLCYYKNDALMVNVKFALQLCQSGQPEMRLDYSGTKIIQIFSSWKNFGRG